MTANGPVISQNTLQVQMQYISGGELVENVYHVHKGTAWSSVDIGIIGGIFENWESTEASPLRSDAVGLIRITVTDLTSLTAGRLDNQLPAAISGSNTSPVMPNNVTFALKGNIQGRGKGRAGRTFWIGLAENQCLASLIVEATAVDIQTALDALITAIGTGVPGAALCVMHLFVAGVYQTDAPTSPITHWTFTDLTLDSMKDRLPRHKAHKRS